MEVPIDRAIQDVHEHAQSMLGTMGYRLRIASHHQSSVCLVQPRHRQRGTHTHGGILMGLLDIAGILSNLYGKRGKVETLTLSLSTTFLAAVHSQKLAAIGELTKAGNSVYFANSKVIDIASETILATAQGTFRIRPKKRDGRPRREEA